MQRLLNPQMKHVMINLLSTFIGCFITAAGLVMFTIPNHIAPGGSSGLATSIAAFVPLSIGVLTWLINIPILCAAIKILGLRAGIYTLIASTVLSMFMDLLAPFFPVFTDNKLMAAVLGGLLIGAGIGIAFLRGISMGGTDQLSILLGRLLPNVSTGYILMMCDGIVVVIAAITFKDLDVFLYSVICVFCASKAIDTIMEGMNHARAFFIITDHGKEIAEELNRCNDNGCTIISASGSYSGKSKDVILTVVHPDTAMQTLDIVTRIDPNSFTFMSPVAEVHGKGFKHYRADLNL